MNRTGIPINWESRVAVALWVIGLTAATILFGALALLSLNLIAKDNWPPDVGFGIFFSFSAIVCLVLVVYVLRKSLRKGTWSRSKTNPRSSKGL